MHSCWPTYKTFPALCVHGTDSTELISSCRLYSEVCQPHWQDKPSGHMTTNHHPKAFWWTGGIDKALAGTPSSWETRESADWRCGGRLARRRRVRVQYVWVCDRRVDVGQPCSEGDHRWCVTIVIKQLKMRALIGVTDIKYLLLAGRRSMSFSNLFSRHNCLVVNLTLSHPNPAWHHIKPLLSFTFTSSTVTALSLFLKDHSSLSQPSS